jgi:hypothetical protein
VKERGNAGKKGVTCQPQNPVTLDNPLANLDFGLLARRKGSKQGGSETTTPAFGFQITQGLSVL